MEEVYISDVRPSVAYGEHGDAVVAIMLAAGGSDVRETGATATGDDEAGDELALSADFPAGIDATGLDDLEAALEELLDVGVRVAVSPVPSTS